MLDAQTVEVRISMFADDTQLYHSSESSIREGFNILDIYSKASGAQVNVSKTKGLYIGQWKNKKPVVSTIDWVPRADGLGTVFGYNINYEDLWLQKFFKFKAKIQNWSKRDLTMEGKRLLIYSYIISGLSYMIDIYSSNISEEVIKKTKDLIKEFLWNGKVWRVAQKTMSLKKVHGGVEIPDLDALIEAKRLHWIMKIHFSQPSSWNAIGKYYIAYYDEPCVTQQFLLGCSLFNGISMKRIPKFYQCCLESWARNNAKKTVSSKQDILDSQIFGNANIVNRHNQCIFLKHWCASGIVTIHDIWNSNLGKFKDGVEIMNRLAIKTNWMTEYEIIKHAIPKDWKNKLKGNACKNEIGDLLSNPQNLLISQGEIKRNGKFVNPLKLKFKEIYFQCLYPLPKPKCMKSWSSILDLDIIWNDVFKRYSSICYGRKQLEYHWKVIHRAVYTEGRLERMNRSNGICGICKTTRETTIHLLFTCNKLEEVWRLIENKLNIILTLQIKLNVENVLFGLSLTSETNSYVLNCMILKSKWQIWKERNRVKFEKTEPITSLCLVEKILKEFRKTIKTVCLSKQGKYLNEEIKEFLEIL